ncbi:LacI family DNA-binding transcriptional regulator [Pontiellaceae bacterium B1224]|nr:LacI family DNA-binding transcriptional regulator [Pontiellaceae bacterium B1224]
MDKDDNSLKASGKEYVRPITYSDIAKELGVSKMTVSLAMRNHPRISESTRIRVQKKASEMNYQSDPMLTALSSYRSMTKEKPLTAELAWINFNADPDELKRHEVFKRYWNGATATARQFGFKLEEFKTSAIPLERMNHIFKARGIRGILLAPVLHNAVSPAELNEFPWNDYSTVRFGDSLSFLRVDSVSSAQIFNVIMTFDQILGKGYERIGYVGEYDRRHLFSAGYLWAQQALPPSQHLTPLFWRKDGSADKLPMLKQWMNQQTPDAIISGDAQLFPLLKKLKYRIPEDVGLAGLTKHDSPINAGVDQNPEEIGRIAVRALVAQLNENRFGIAPAQKEILVEGQWFDGSMLPSKV